ncbi:MAG: HU family DNA-binding protein [Mediterranea sp.]|jgi:predicted histone-like DNA-binding protein|nr:HU family DNA-binding protein [Mediterranea sp.]
MAINYEWHETPVRPGEKDKKKLHPRITTNGRIDTKDIQERIHESCSLTEGDVIAAISALSDIMGYELVNGRLVHIDGIGSFYPVLTTNGEVTADMNLRKRSHKVALKGIKFKPDKELLWKVRHPKFQFRKDSWTSDKLSEIEIDMQLKEYFSVHRVMTRRDMENACGFKRTKAITELRRLQDEGKLTNINTTTQPIYMPMPGYYGLSRDSVPMR